MGKVVLFAEQYYPEQASTSHFLTHIAEGLADEFPVWVITGPPTIGLRATAAPSREQRNGVQIARCGGTRFSQQSLPGRLLNMVSRTVMMFWRGLRVCKIGDVVIVVTNPPLLPFIVLLLKWLRGCRFVLLIHDVYPEAAIAAGLLTPSSPLVQAGELFNRLLYRRSDRIVTLGRDMSWLVESKLGGHSTAVRCIPHWYDPDAPPPFARDAHPLLMRYGLADRFVVLYAGNMGRTHDLAVVSRAAEALHERRDIHFICMGSGAKRAWLERFVSEHGLSNVLLLPPCPPSELILHLSACDVAVITFVRGMAGISVPSRLYNQMAAGRPILAATDAWSELALVIREERIGWVVEPGDVEGVVAVLQAAVDDREGCRTRGARAAQAVQERFSLSEAMTSYKRLCSELLSR